MHNFQALGVGTKVCAALKEQGITQPTPIQEKVIPILLNKKDVIAQAQTGTGKTFAFVLPILELLNPSNDNIQALIVTPTRELALQITTEIKKIIKNFANINVLAVYGGQDVERQIKKLQGGRQIVVCTPGRVLDHLRRGTISLAKVSMVVLDEADQMLHMGFLSEIEEILRKVPQRRLTMLFSATMPPQIKSLAVNYLKSPEIVHIKGTQITLEEIKQIIIETSDRAKQENLCRLIDEHRPYLALIFCRTKRRASTLNAALQEKGYNCDELHGDLSQTKREQVMKKFRQAEIQLLVATDVAARGLDVEGVTHIYNYDIPHDTESYIHRIGRTGRAGGEGVAVTFVAPKDRKYLEIIEKGIKSSIKKGTTESSPRGIKENKGDKQKASLASKDLPNTKYGRGKAKPAKGKPSFRIKSDDPGNRRQRSRQKAGRTK